MNKEDFTSLHLVSVRWWNASAYYAISLAEALQQAGFPVTVGGRKKSPPIEKARQRQIPTYESIHLESFNPFMIVKNIWQLKKFIRRKGIQFLVAHRPEDHAYGGLLKKLYFQELPFIRVVSDVRPPRNNRPNRWLHQHATDFFIFSCQANLQRYQNVWDIFSNRSRVIYSAVDTDFFSPRPMNTGLRKKLGIPEDAPVVGIIGRLSPAKDHATFLRAAGRVHQKFPEAYFVISGEPVEIQPDALLAEAQKAGLADRVLYLEKQPDVRELIAAIDIGVVASRESEAVCRVAVEYMAMGKPQVVTDVNVLPEIIEDGVNGFVVPAGDDDEMAKKIEQLLGNTSLRAQMGQQARQRAVERYSYPVLVSQMLEVFKTVRESTIHVPQMETR